MAGRADVGDMADFVDRHDLGHVPHVVDDSGELWARAGVPGQPAWIFVDGETGELTRHIGALEGADLEAALDALRG